MKRLIVALVGGILLSASLAQAQTAPQSRLTISAAAIENAIAAPALTGSRPNVRPSVAAQGPNGSSWWSRNWKWAVPVIAGAAVVVGIIAANGGYSSGDGAGY